jgi:hypothetical protein
VNHGEEEEEEENGKEDVILRGPRIGAAQSLYLIARRLERCFVTAAGSMSGRCCF